MALRSASVSNTSPWTNVVLLRSSRSDMNSRLPVERLSYTTTSDPSAASLSARLLPINPAPPVIIARRTPDLGFGSAISAEIICSGQPGAAQAAQHTLSPRKRQQPSADLRGGRAPQGL